MITDDGFPFVSHQHACLIPSLLDDWPQQRQSVLIRKETVLVIMSNHIKGHNNEQYYFLCNVLCKRVSFPLLIKGTHGPEPGHSQDRTCRQDKSEGMRSHRMDLQESQTHKRASLLLKFYETTLTKSMAKETQINKANI